MPLTVQPNRYGGSKVDALAALTTSEDYIVFAVNTENDKLMVTCHSSLSTAALDDFLSQAVAAFSTTKNPN